MKIVFTQALLGSNHKGKSKNYLPKMGPEGVE
jgi:hypothetical protein